MVSETGGTILKRDGASGYRGPDLKLYVRDVRDPSGKKRAFVVKSWGTVKDAKEAIQQYITHVPVHAQRLYFGSPLLSSGKELPNYRTLHDAGIYRSGETLMLDIISLDETNSTYRGSTSSLQRAHQTGNDLCISTSLLNSTPRPLSKTIQDARLAFALGIKPDLIMDGSGGSYYIHDVKKNRIAVFKPADEEPYAQNNPRGYLPQHSGDVEGLRKGIEPGEACIREVAAYLLDHEGFADVPMTTLVEARHPAFNTNGARLKVSEGGASIGSHALGSSSDLTSLLSGIPKKVGSFQEFVRSEFSMDDISPSKLSIEQVHKIAILDIRLLNADRNPANLLCRRLRDNTLELVPIDHGYCLRSVCDVSWMDWCWLDWPQLKEPLSSKSKDYIQRLDVEADARMLEELLNISQEAIDHIRASTALLKAGVEAGLTLYDIAILCCRNDNLGERPSMLEHLTAMASELAKVALENEDWHHATACRALEEQLTPQRISVSHKMMRAGVVSRDRSSSRFHRCASSGEFLVADHRSNLAKALERQISAPPPVVAMSSGSDSSADNSEDTKEEVKDEIDIWAHNIIEDSFKTAHHPTVDWNHRQFESSSDGGSSCLGSSPKGFWHVPPGSLDDNSSASSFDEDGSSLGTSPPYSLQEFPVSAPETLDVRHRTTLVTFAPSDSAKASSGNEVSACPPTTVLLDSGQLACSPSMPGYLRLGSSGSIPRRKSYTSLNRRFSSSNLSVPSSTTKVEKSNGCDGMKNHPLMKNDKAEEHEFYRTYFLKFIDLVIAREMARHQQQPLSTMD